MILTYQVDIKLASTNCMHIYAPYACLVPKLVRRGHWIFQSGIYGGFEPPLVLRTKYNPLQEQQVLLPSQPFLQPLYHLFNNKGKFKNNTPPQPYPHPTFLKKLCICIIYIYNIYNIYNIHISENIYILRMSSMDLFLVETKPDG